MAADAGPLLLVQPPAPRTAAGAVAADRDAVAGRWAGAGGPRWPSTLLIESAGAPRDQLLAVLDAQASHPQIDEALAVARAIAPRAALVLVGGPLCAADSDFLARLRTVLPACTLVVGGPEVERDPAAALVRFGAADGALAARGLGAPWVQGFGAPGVCWRGGPAAPVEAGGPLRLGTPQLHLFPWRRYDADGFVGLVGQPVVQLGGPWLGHRPRDPADLRAEVEAWARAGAVGLRLRGGPLALDPDALRATLDALRGRLPFVVQWGSALMDPAIAARVREAGACRLVVTVRLGAQSDRVMHNGVEIERDALADGLRAAGLPGVLRVDGLDAPERVAAARQLARRLGLSPAFAPSGQVLPSPGLVEATAPRRRARAAAALRKLAVLIARRAAVGGP